jgi:hypothetical protein
MSLMQPFNPGIIAAPLQETALSRPGRSSLAVYEMVFVNALSLLLATFVSAPCTASIRTEIGVLQATAKGTFTLSLRAVLLLASTACVNSAGLFAATLVSWHVTGTTPRTSYLRVGESSGSGCPAIADAGRQNEATIAVPAARTKLTIKALPQTLPKQLRRTASFA